MYASYHFSHPILPERLGALGWSGKEKKADPPKADGEKASVVTGREL